jgi:hypothetical protein
MNEIFSTAYLPPVSWFVHFLQAHQPVIDLGEFYLKQSYRNRCCILSANGELALSIPVKKLATKTAVKDILIENEFCWQKQHWEAISSAYNSSPYFQYYRHRFEPFYVQPFTHLHTFNQALLELCMNILRLEKQYAIAQTYQESETDFRQIVHPKKNADMMFPTYPQVFMYKYGSVPNLSIIDLIYNEGPKAASYLSLIKT